MDSHQTPRLRTRALINKISNAASRALNFCVALLLIPIMIRYLEETGYGLWVQVSAFPVRAFETSRLCAMAVRHRGAPCGLLIPFNVSFMIIHSLQNP